jgi:hypothetical protein
MCRIQEGQPRTKLSRMSKHIPVKRESGNKARQDEQACTSDESITTGLVPRTTVFMTSRSADFSSDTVI